MRAEAVGFAALLHFARRPATTPELEAEFARGLALAEELGPSELLLRLLNQAAYVAVPRRPQDAWALYERLIPTAKATGDRELVAHAMVNRGLGDYYLGDFTQQRPALEAAHAFMRAHGANRDLVRCLLMLASAAGRFGEFTAAQRYVEEAERAKPAWSTFDERAHAFRRTVMANWLGNVEETIRWAEEGQRIAKDHGLIATVDALDSLGALGRLHVGEVLLESGRYAEARDVLLPAADAFEKRRDRIPDVEAQLALAYVGLGDVGRARECVTRAKLELPHTDYEAVAFVGLAAAALAESDAHLEEAERTYRETIVAIDRFGSMWIGLARTYVDFAAFLIRQRRFGEARELLGKARNFYRDPLAARRREQIDALLAQCEVAAG